ncbi:MAG: DUF2231 domain-containing protein, partial [Bacteroidia bacterium]
MKSKASIKGHSIHPMLVPFPIAFFIGTFISDSIFLIKENPFFAQMGKYLEACGIIFALFAAVPGIIDYFYTVPPDSTAQKRASKHGQVNLGMVCIFAIALLIRQKGEVDFNIILFIELIGVVLLSIAGWLGGTLVARNQIVVDHRYANAGKWKEERLETSHGLVELHNMGELQLNQMKLIHVNDKRIVIAKSESGIHAFEDRCTHRGGSLADGSLVCGT